MSKVIDLNSRRPRTKVKLEIRRDTNGLGYVFRASVGLNDIKRLVSDQELKLGYISAFRIARDLKKALRYNLGIYDE